MSDAEPEFKGPLSGHGLRFEGRVSNYFGMGSGEGRGRCSCGAESSVLPTTAARQRWHRKHNQVLYIHDNGRVCVGFVTNIEDTSWDDIDDLIAAGWKLVREAPRG